MALLESSKNVFIVGIKGVAMAGLARIFVQMGKQVSGSDTSDPQITDEMLGELRIANSELTDVLPIGVDLVVYSAAHGGIASAQVQGAQRKGIPVVSQAAIIAELIGLFPISIAICGCHGKTTTSSLTAFVLHELGAKVSWLVGAPYFKSMTNNNSPAGEQMSNKALSQRLIRLWRRNPQSETDHPLVTIFPGGNFEKGSDVFVFEADEYGVCPPQDKTPKILLYHPTHIICTNIDFDHPDIYRDIDHVRSTFAEFFTHAKHVYECNSASLEGNIRGVRDCLQDLGYDSRKIDEAIVRFGGVARRLEYHGEEKGIVYYDDYAHHPAEIKVTIDELRKQYPDRRLIVLFQSHTYSRTNALKEGFVDALASADIALIDQVFPSAREKEGVLPISAKDLEELAHARGHHNIYGFESRDTLLKHAQTIMKKGDVVVTMGAGDIYKGITKLQQHPVASLSAIIQPIRRAHGRLAQDDKVDCRDDDSMDFVSDTIKCKDCKSLLSYSGTYDAYYCTICNTWAEKPCREENCPHHCNTRPIHPLNSMAQDTGHNERLVIHHNHPIGDKFTWHVDVTAKKYVNITSESDLSMLVHTSDFQSTPRRYLLGNGANTLFAESFFDGMVIEVSNTGIEKIQEDDEYAYWRIAAGEDWIDLVERMVLRENLGGLENLAYIPGKVGSAPIQNIAAYGEAFEDVCESVEYILLPSLEHKICKGKECEFAYRQSKFKSMLKESHHGFIIWSVVLKLAKPSKHTIEAGYFSNYESLQSELSHLDGKRPTIQDIYRAVVALRKKKLPEVSEVGTNGSLFMNPIVKGEKVKELLKKFPKLQCYPTEKMKYTINSPFAISAKGGSASGGRHSHLYKIAAGHIFDEIGWKGKRVGKVGTWKNHALVLCNYGTQDPGDIIKVIEMMQDDFEKATGIHLEPEINIVK